MKRHSIVDNITNSSSTTYTWPVIGAEEKIRAAIQEIMNLCGVDKPFEEVFTMKVEVDPRWVDVLERNPEYYKGFDIEEAKKTGEMFDHDYDYYGIRHINIKVYPKDNPENDILGNIIKCFNSAEVSQHTYLGEY